jgi:chromosome segregation ATPase
MTRVFKLMTLGALGAWLMTSTGCEDKVCQEALQTCKKDSTDQRKECAGNMAKLQELKTELADAQAKLDSLTKENEGLKAKAEEGGKSKGKPAKGKKKRRHRR